MAVEKCANEISPSLGMVVDKVWLISGQFRHISAKETCNMSIHGECFLSLLFRLVLFNYLGAHKRKGG